MKKKIKILHVVSALGSGGVECFLLNNYKYINRELIHFDFVTHRDEGLVEGELKKLEATIYHISNRREHPFKTAVELYRILRSNNYDIIHFHGNIEITIQLIVSFLAKIQVRICHSHTYFKQATTKQKLINKISQILIQIFGTHFFSCSKSSAEWGFSKHIVNMNKYYIIHNAIDLNKFKFSEEVRKKYRSDLNIEDKFVVGNVGRFEDVKNHDFILKTFKYIVNVEPNAILLLVGEGKLESHIRRRIRELGICENVKLLGTRNDISELFQAMDIFVLPSKSEGLGIVLIEAQASGLRCYASDRVTEEVKITQFIDFISIDQGYKIWRDKIISGMEYTRVDCSEILKKAGYDVRLEGKRLQDLYYKLLMNSN